MTEVRAENLGFYYDGRTVFDGLNFHWSEPRIGLIGRNGSGKSTLARLIAGLIEPTSGTLKSDGLDLYVERDEALKRVGIVFQNPDQQIIFPTVIEELKFGLSQLGYKDAEIRAKKILKRYGRESWSERLVASLSQGQRHFLALISILEMRPEILILDEPFTGLDIPTVMRLQRVLDGFEGMIIHITHEANLIENYDRVVWLEKGGIKADGKPKTVLADYEARMREMGENDADTGF